MYLRLYIEKTFFSFLHHPDQDSRIQRRRRLLRMPQRPPTALYGPLKELLQKNSPQNSGPAPNSEGRASARPLQGRAPHPAGAAVCMECGDSPARVSCTESASRHPARSRRMSGLRRFPRKLEGRAFPALPSVPAPRSEFTPNPSRSRRKSEFGAPRSPPLCARCGLMGLDGYLWASVVMTTPKQIAANQGRCSASVYIDTVLSLTRKTIPIPSSRPSTT